MTSKNAKIFTFLTIVLLTIMFTGLVSATTIDNNNDTQSFDSSNVADLEVSSQATDNTNVEKTFEDTTCNTNNIKEEAQTKTIDKNTIKQPPNQQ